MGYPVVLENNFGKDDEEHVFVLHKFFQNLCVSVPLWLIMKD